MTKPTPTEKTTFTLEDIAEATARPAWTPPAAEDSIDLRNDATSLLVEFQNKLAELNALVTEIGASREILDNGLSMGCLITSKQLLSGRTKIHVNMKITLPAIKAEVNF